MIMTKFNFVLVLAAALLLGCIGQSATAQSVDLSSGFNADTIGVADGDAGGTGYYDPSEDFKFIDFGPIAGFTLGPVGANGADSPNTVLLDVRGTQAPVSATIDVDDTGWSYFSVLHSGFRDNAIADAVITITYTDSTTQEFTNWQIVSDGGISWAGTAGNATTATVPETTYRYRVSPATGLIANSVISEQTFPGVDNSKLVDTITFDITGFDGDGTAQVGVYAVSYSPVPEPPKPPKPPKSSVDLSSDFNADTIGVVDGDAGGIGYYDPAEDFKFIDFGTVEDFTLGPVGANGEDSPNTVLLDLGVQAAASVTIDVDDAKWSDFSVLQSGFRDNPIADAAITITYTDTTTQEFTNWQIVSDGGIRWGGSAGLATTAATTDRYRVSPATGLITNGIISEQTFAGLDDSKLVDTITFDITGFDDDGIAQVGVYALSYTPVPEPQTFVLISMGLMSVMVRRRRSC